MSSSLERWEKELLDLEGRNVFERRSTRTAHLLLFVIIALIVSVVIWAANAHLDEVTRGEGKIIPSTKTQIIQHLEGGIVSDIFVKEGEKVTANQPLLRLENVSTEVALEEKKKALDSLIIKRYRLEAEAEGQDMLDLTNQVRDSADNIVTTEIELFSKRREHLQGEILLLENQVTQKEQELAELHSRLEQLARQEAISQREFDILQSLVKDNLAPKLDLVRVEEKIHDVTSRISGVMLSIPRTKTQIEEAKNRIVSKKIEFRSQAQSELVDVNVKINSLEEELKASKDKQDRTIITSPINGTVNKIAVSTIGGVVRGGESLIEIVPEETNIVIEGKINPKDRAVLHTGLKAIIKISAYDFAVHGGLHAVLEDISADTFKDGDGPNNAPYYRVRLVAEENSLGDDKPIIPGMQAQVDILTGEKTVLQYFMKPILRAQSQALTER